MHDAFEADPILDKLPLGIESIACYGKIVDESCDNSEAETAQTKASGQGSTVCNVSSSSV